VAVGGTTLPASPGAAYKWSSLGNDWLPVLANDVLEAGAVLWLYTPTDATLALTGTYTDPTNRPVALGGSFQSGAGLETSLLPIQNSDFALWYHDPIKQSWQIHASPVPDPDTSFPQFLSPGEAMFVRVGAPAELVAPDSALRVRYYHQDHLGSSSVTTDAAGSLVEEIAYYPFGIPRHELQLRPIEEPYGYTQKERDQESGLHYFEARYLAGRLSRFVSADPKLANPDALPPDERRKALSQPQKLNLYAYVLNNPLKYQDPTGLDNLCYEAPKNPTGGQEAAEGVAGLFCLGAEVDAGKDMGEAVKWAIEDRSKPVAIAAAVTAPIWMPIVFAKSVTWSVAGDLAHIAKGAGRAVVDSIDNRFKTVEAEPPPPLDLPSHEETSMRSSSTAHEDAPPPPPKLAPAPAHVSPRPRLCPAPNPPRVVPRESSAREPIERDRKVDY
jgi:RHS repeat-associated protein